MQAIKDKLHDMSVMRQVKADAKAEEKAEKELAKARMEVAHEIRLAREAEAQMDLHAIKAGMKAEREMTKFTGPHPTAHGTSANNAAAKDPDMTMVGAPGSVDMAGAPTSKKLL